MNQYLNVNRVGNKILVREWDEKEGFQKKEVVDYRPTFYILGDDSSGWKTIEGKSLQVKKPGNLSDCKEFFQTYEDVEQFEIYGNTDYVIQYISDRYQGIDENFDPDKVRVFNIDIEVLSAVEKDGKLIQGEFPKASEAKYPIVSIVVKDSKTNKYYVWSTAQFEIDRDDVVGTVFENEGDLLDSFVDFWGQYTPHVVTGWNIKQFDIPYLYNRIETVLGTRKAKMLSPWRKVYDDSYHDQYGNDIDSYDFVGISILDYLELYKNYTYSERPNYRLGTIAKIELGDDKLDFGDESNFLELYLNDPQRFVEYNLHDVEIVDQLDQKLKLLNLVYTVAYLSGQPFENVLSPIKTWDSIIFNYLKKQKIAIPQSKFKGKDSAYSGAYVKEPKIGPSKWIVSFDLASLYPSLIRQYNIGPDTLITHVAEVDGEVIINPQVEDFLDEKLNLQFLKDMNACICASGYLYSKEKKSFLSELMEIYYNKRKQYKKKMLDAKNRMEKKKELGESFDEEKAESILYDTYQQAAKILLNSCYGALGSPYFRYFDIAHAESITLSGQMAIRWVGNKINEYLDSLIGIEKDRVIASDTDSIYLELDDLVQKFFKGKSTEEMVDILDRICKDRFEPFILKLYERLADYTNAYQQMMFMDREVIASSGFWTRKKRYALLVHDMEGVRYSEPQLKIMGLESKRSSTPEVFQKWLEEAYRILLTSDEESIQKFIKQKKKELHKLTYQNFCGVSSVNGMEKWSQNGEAIKGTPMHIKASLLYNQLIDRYDLTHKYPRIGNGDKVMLLFLKTPNPTQSSVIAFPISFPKEFNLDSYIDRKKSFDKYFLHPLESILELYGWSSEPITTLENFFG